MKRTAARALALAGLTALMSACSGEDSGLKINSFTASPMTVTAGERTTLSWDVTADSISITNVRTGMVIAQSAEATGTVMSAALDETTTFTLEAKAGDEAITRNVTVTVTTEGAPVVDSFTATPAEIDVGASSTLSWQTTGATSVSITAGGTSIVTDGAADGEFSVMPIATTTYTLVAKAADGQTSMATTTITVNTENQVPAVQVFTASPNPIAAGASTTLSWTVLYADTIVVTDADSNEVYNGTNGAGMVSVTPAATTTYTLVATNAQGAGTDSVTVTVNGTIGATIDSFLANPTTVILGQASVLSWAASNADRIEITTAAGTTTVSTSLTGMISVLPAATTEYTLTAFNPAGNASFAATVTVNPAAPAILGFGAAPNPAAIGGSTTLSWNVLGADTVRVTRGTTVEYDGTQGTSSIQIPVTTTSTTFMLTASNAEGASTSQVTVYGHQAPTITTFTAGPNPFAGTATITLTWAAVNVQALELFQDGAAVAGFPGVATSTGTVDASGTLDVVLTTHSTFVLRATSQGGQDEATITVFQQVDESEPNDDAATAQVLTTSGAPVVGMVSPAGDEDWYAVTVPAGGWIRAWTDDGAGACPFDTYMTLTSTDGVTRLAFDDDDGVGACSFLQPGAIDPGAANLAAGTYFVRVRAYSSSVTGTYVLHVEFGGPGCGNSIIEPS
ncbi:MAG: pre-peptidase C-terminal domain-containing protein, partial [Myxococcales bacterium]|nr:pre-peptidase C-terminal domain-containing protein [Myxococcales bacterium]